MLPNTTERNMTDLAGWLRAEFWHRRARI